MPSDFSQLVVFIGGPDDGATAWFDFTDVIVDPGGRAVIWRQGQYFAHQYIAATPIGQRAEVLRLLHRKVLARSRALPSATE